MRGSAEDIRNSAGFDNLSRIHHHQPVTQVCDDSQIMGNEDDRCAGLVLNVAQQLQVLVFCNDSCYQSGK